MTTKQTIKNVADLINAHAEMARNSYKDHVEGIVCGCKSFIPFTKEVGERGDLAYILHIAEALSKAGLLNDFKPFSNDEAVIALREHTVKEYDDLHISIGLGYEWMNSDRRKELLKIENDELNKLDLIFGVENVLKEEKND